ncbi:DinB family protein [Nocardia amikacinitolerans]|uniref:DinB family protein n=1 Tax=Nocardia amikacinitolerans TaxID=756689 RepID=UPI0036A93704
MPASSHDILRWQFDLTWSLARYHFDALTPGDFHWEPGPLIWTVHRGADGNWRPDWAEVEPDPIPVPTVAWLTWHIDWWWSTALAHVEGRTPAPREEMFWAGDAALTRLDDLRAAWATALEAADPDAPAAYPWPADTGLTVTHLAAWVNAELMKNAAEIGQLRLLRAASLACGV